MSNAGESSQKLSTKRGPLYVHYLSTTTLVRCIDDIERQLSTSWDELGGRRRELLSGIKEDCLVELAGRQLTLEDLVEFYGSESKYPEIRPSVGPSEANTRSSPASRT